MGPAIGPAPVRPALPRTRRGNHCLVDLRRVPAERRRSPVESRLVSVDRGRDHRSCLHRAVPRGGWPPPACCSSRTADSTDTDGRRDAGRCRPCCGPRGSPGPRGAGVRLVVDCRTDPDTGPDTTRQSVLDWCHRRDRRSRWSGRLGARIHSRARSRPRRRSDVADGSPGDVRALRLRVGPRPSAGDHPAAASAPTPQEAGRSAPSALSAVVGSSDIDGVRTDTDIHSDPVPSRLRRDGGVSRLLPVGNSDSRWWDRDGRRRAGDVAAPWR